MKEGGYLPRNLRPHVDALLAKKKAEPELGEGPRVEVLNAYIDKSLSELYERVESLPSVPKRDWSGLNEMFVKACSK